MSTENRIKELELKAKQLKKEVGYYDAMQQGLKLVLNGSYGAFLARHFVLHNNNIGSAITAQGRDLTKTMDRVSSEYWVKLWHEDYDLHSKLGIKNVKPISGNTPTSIYGDTDSIFVSFEPAMKNCEWRNMIFNDEYLSSIDEPFIIFSKNKIKTNNNDLLVQTDDLSVLTSFLDDSNPLLLVDGSYVKNWDFKKAISKYNDLNIKWNWSSERDFIQGIDAFRIGDYFKEKLDEYARSFHLDENKEDFELERISESIINIQKKKYIQHISHEDGLDYESLHYIFPKGVELIQSSSSVFAREKIMAVVKYIFANSTTLDVKNLLGLIKDLRKEFELAEIDDICKQSSCSNYTEKVLNDKSLPLAFVSGTHYAVKASAYYNYLLGSSSNKKFQDKYEFIKSGDKVKFYYSADKSVNPVFAYHRGSYPIEFAPNVNYDLQFEKTILSPLNLMLESLGLEKITKRMRVVMGIFS